MEQLPTYKFICEIPEGYTDVAFYEDLIIMIGPDVKPLIVGSDGVVSYL